MTTEAGGQTVKCIFCGGTGEQSEYAITSVALSPPMPFDAIRRAVCSDPPTATRGDVLDLIDLCGRLLDGCGLALKFWSADHPNDTAEATEAREKIRAAVADAINPGAAT